MSAIDDSLIERNIARLSVAAYHWPSGLPAEEAINYTAPIRPPLD